MYLIRMLSLDYFVSFCCVCSLVVVLSACAPSVTRRSELKLARRRPNYIVTIFCTVLYMYVFGVFMQ